jgi:ribokinase
MRSIRPKVAVVGHVEWVTFARVPHIPSAGEIVHALDPFEEPAGGGGVAAVQLARLAGGAVLVTALGEDEYGRRSVERLAELGVEVWAARRAEPTRTATTLVDDARERTITTYGSRLEAVGADRDIPWEKLAQMDAVYFTAGDAAAMRAARAARVLVASPRALHALGHGIPLDALVLSAEDKVEREEAAQAEADARLLVLTDGGHGGSYRLRESAESKSTDRKSTSRKSTDRKSADRKSASRDDSPPSTSGASGAPATGGKWLAAELPGEPRDSYGCGDSFAAGLTYALGADLAIPDALALAARCGATCLTGRGPYERQLSAADLGAGHVE